LEVGTNQSNLLGKKATKKRKKRGSTLSRKEKKDTPIYGRCPGNGREPF